MTLRLFVIALMLISCAMPKTEAKAEAAKWMKTMGVSGNVNCYNYDKLHNTVCDIVDNRGFSYKLICSYEVGCVLLQ